ncbi:MAG: DUF4869 domain-containing protein [Pseudobutyrivibrio sp.]|uniref:DUF4869 domain-containing protein n=1 Tax=Pseudobutyrivibrio sp. TaxID=2014367 RepID=UPI001B25B5B0|nr:DUF4869 domain-containing protein [Pseudobutyrivibrio sp.]MBO6283375.1 DUF4869 domain-containing protein [Pseudobutyrivibrio sp.]MBQ8489945.1 DUF4869 domain-containing protein [Pseudobutyrivibrio sp.]
MLNIYFGNMDEAIYNPPVYFKNSYTDEWILNARSKEMIKDVDKSNVIDARVIDSPVLGGISPRELSGGVKTLIAIDQTPDRVFNASACGDNCAKWLLQMGKEKDVTVNLRHIMDFGDGIFEINILNENLIVHSMAELVPVAGKYVR